MHEIIQFVHLYPLDHSTFGVRGKDVLLTPTLLGIEFNREQILVLRMKKQ
jgi:hypothetical protein